MRAALVVMLLSGCAGVGGHTVRVLDTPAVQKTRDWDQVFQTPTALQVTAWVTGEVFTGPSILIDADNPRTPAADKVERWVPSVSYLVEHPGKGAVLMDAGVAPVETGACAYGLRPAYWVPCRTSKGQDAVARLHARGKTAADLSYLMLSHFHGDHVGGLQALVADGLPGVLTTTPEWEAVTSFRRPLEGYLDHQVRGTYGVRVLDEQQAVEMPYVGRVWDLFSDGSVWLIPVAGHSRGQLAALLNTLQGPVLLTFDASHLAANFQHRVVPGATVDDGKAMDAIDRLRAFATAYPRLRVVFGHEPSQWTGVTERVLAHPMEDL